jgi:hypothetical protein
VFDFMLTFRCGAGELIEVNLIASGFPSHSLGDDKTVSSPKVDLELLVRPFPLLQIELGNVVVLQADSLNLVFCGA